MLSCETKQKADEAWKVKEQLRDAGFLREFNNPAAISKNGQVQVTLCGDGRFSIDKLMHLSFKLRAAGRPEPHILHTVHGGAIYYARSKTVHRIMPTQTGVARESFRALHRQYRQATKMGKGDKVLAYIHSVCGQANDMLRLSELEQLYLAVDMRAHFQECGIDPSVVEIAFHFSRLNETAQRPDIADSGWELETWLVNCEEFMRRGPVIPSLTHRPGQSLAPADLWPNYR